MKHGLRKNGQRERLYRIWDGMIGRCERPSQKGYARYGAKGITVCSEWRHDYVAFRTWAYKNGYRDDLTIDRINGNLGYCPENCRWATKKDQNNNRRGNRLLTVHGITKSIAQWAEETGVNQFTLYDRQENGWSEDEMFAKPYTIRHEGGKV